MKKILSIQVINLLLFILILFNRKFHFFEADMEKAIHTGILVTILISIGKIINELRNNE